MSNVQIWVTDQFEGFHRWKDAPPEVSFLRFWHRHMFKVKVGVNVTHNNRQVEFFILKRALSQILVSKLDGEKFESSCEQIAWSICNLLEALGYDVAYVDVSEDGENGATVYPEKQPLPVEEEEVDVVEE